MPETITATREITLGEAVREALAEKLPARSTVEQQYRIRICYFGVNQWDAPFPKKGHTAAAWSILAGRKTLARIIERDRNAWESIKW